MLTPLHILALMDNMHARRVTEAASAATWVSRRAGGAERATGSGWSPGALGASWCCGAGSKLHQHAHPTEVRLPSLHGQLLIRARSCQMAFLIGFGPRGFRSCFSLNGSASQISRTIGDTGASQILCYLRRSQKSPRDPKQMTRGLRFRSSGSIMCLVSVCAVPRWF